jgi:t-SNARE complex subunit (syntaxin)
MPSSAFFQKLRRGVQRAESDAASDIGQLRRNQAVLRSLLRQEDQSQAQVQALLRRHQQCLRRARLRAMERDMRDLVEMFHQLGHLLTGSSAVERIELQVADAKETTDRAANETHAASEHASRATLRYAILGAMTGAILGAPVGLGLMGVSVGSLTGLILSSRV